ncbi:MAG: hypothetical protein MH204_01620, partial [Fimbriimonadaceae bacterium]|nr:hypothetical protein [Fimbriimonadaceae bacterium]
LVRLVGEPGTGRKAVVPAAGGELPSSGEGEDASLFRAAYGMATWDDLLGFNNWTGQAERFVQALVGTDALNLTAPVRVNGVLLEPDSAGRGAEWAVRWAAENQERPWAPELRRQIDRWIAGRLAAPRRSGHEMKGLAAAAKMLPGSVGLEQVRSAIPADLSGRTVDDLAALALAAQKLAAPRDAIEAALDQAIRAQVGRIQVPPFPTDSLIDPTPGLNRALSAETALDLIRNDRRDRMDLGVRMMRQSSALMDLPAQREFGLPQFDLTAGRTTAHPQDFVSQADLNRLSFGRGTGQLLATMSLATSIRGSFQAESGPAIEALVWSDGGLRHLFGWNPTIFGTEVRAYLISDSGSPRVVPAIPADLGFKEIRLRETDGGLILVGLPIFTGNPSTPRPSGTFVTASGRRIVAQAGLEGLEAPVSAADLSGPVRLEWSVGGRSGATEPQRLWIDVPPRSEWRGLLGATDPTKSAAGSPLVAGDLDSAGLRRGIVVSPPFLVRRSRLDYRWALSGAATIEVFDVEARSVVRRMAAPSPSLRSGAFNLADLRGRRVQLRIVDPGPGGAQALFPGL